MSAKPMSCAQSKGKTIPGSPAGRNPQQGESSGFRFRLLAGMRSLDLPTYVYSYPSKRSYRPMPATKLEDIWDPKESGKVNLYLHVPFCHYRCAYCTLFLTTKHDETLLGRYVDALCRHISLYGPLARNRRVATIYLGGGTPAILSDKDFSRIFSTIRRHFPAQEPDAEICVEGTPDTFSADKLSTLRALGVNRISMGLQTMQPKELKAAGRPYCVEDSVLAIERIKAGFSHINLDLIYGLCGQTAQSWFDSLRKIVSFQPSTISIYPAVARPSTAIGRQMSLQPDRYIGQGEKYSIYDESVSLLAAHGYRQESLTRFTNLEEHKQAYAQEAADFCGIPLIGLGAGARSYKGRYHYSFEQAAGCDEASRIIGDYVRHPLNTSSVIRYGIRLSPEDERRRFVLLNLTINRLGARRYAAGFGRSLEQDFGEELSALREEGCATFEADYEIRLTPRGFKFSSLIAHLFFSDSVRSLECRDYPITRCA